MLIVINTHPSPPGIVGTVAGVKLMDGAEQKDRREIFSGRSLAETQCVHADNRVELGERNAAVRGMIKSAVTQAGPQVAFHSDGCRQHAVSTTTASRIFLRDRQRCRRGVKIRRLVGADE